MNGDGALLSQQVREASPDWRHEQKMLLVANVQDCPRSVESWYALLNAQEEDPELSDRPNEMLLRLYAQATRVLPCEVNVDNELYLRIWIGYAKQQMKASIEDALETFKFLESRNIGDHFALRYTEWAKVELRAGYRTKALQVLKKGLTLRAMPVSDLHRQFLDIYAADKAKADIGTAGRVGQAISPSETGPRERKPQKQEPVVSSPVTRNHSSSSSSSDTAESFGTQEMVTSLSSTITKEDTNGNSGTSLNNPRRFPKRVKPLGPPLRVALGEKAQSGGKEVTKEQGSGPERDDQQEGGPGGVRMQGAGLEGAHPQRSEPEGVNLQGAGPEGSSGPRAGLVGGHMQGAGLGGTQRAGVEAPNMLGTGQEGANLQGEGAKLMGAGSEGPKLPGSGLEGANLQVQGTGPGQARQPLKDRNMNRLEVKGGSINHPRKQHENENIVLVNNKRYQKLGKIGSGGSCDVFKVIDGDCRIYALKRVHLRGKDRMSATSFYQEIDYLERLRGKRHIIQMVDHEVTNKNVLDRTISVADGKIEEDSTIYMVLEYGETDLAGMLATKRKAAVDHAQILDENWLRLYWQHVLEAVETIHKERIVHSDLKPENFLLVKGELKLIDFGIAKAIQNDTTNILRENAMGTVSYMSPEALMHNCVDESGELIKVGRASDIWSLGCILYQMVYGQTPFSHLNFLGKMKEITNPNHRINFPAISNYWLMDAMKKCLCWDPHKRLRIPELLVHPFLWPDLAPKPVIPRGGELQPQDVQQLILDVQRISVAEVSEFKNLVLRLLYSRLNGHGP